MRTPSLRDKREKKKGRGQRAHLALTHEELHSGFLAHGRGGWLAPFRGGAPPGWRFLSARRGGHFRSFDFPN